ncbi:MAG: GNAT family N-acetyltransferase [Cyclobacteriaceae bacterium]
MITIREGDIDEVVSLMQELPEFINPYSKEELRKRLLVANLMLVAEMNEQLVGFKCGYERESGTKKFYSWLGGVLPRHRNKGVAESLLKKMEEWCLERGYEVLEFKTFNEHKGMLIFSIKSGFEIVDVRYSEKDDRKRIVLQKELN